ncbi:formylglycine-generating enzyme family protein [Streptomyces aurantiacus]|uniref:formylglycine-generating enzyme family protein n=1 Tax=Streptomyces aurantiacus TaxID=47760 RepID=UPI0027D91FDB|nr:formylglycine-generating enzyme family protein [Streptomyces aurantiacus]
MEHTTVPATQPSTKSCCAPSRQQPEAHNTPNTPKIPNTSETRVSPAVAAARGHPPHTGYADRIPLPGGTFRMGSEDGYVNAGDGEGPVRDVSVPPFAIDAYAITNARFAAFVDDTGYRTEAEEFGWSYVFAKFLPGTLRKTSPRPSATPWWCGVQGAAWNSPEGPDSQLDSRWDHPVTHVTWRDAAAFCRWAGGRLPTEAEWEYAARGGLDQARFPWGDELAPGGEHRCNIWQGTFPFRNTEADGYAGTAPVDAYVPNGFGLYNVAGNVWEWSADLWQDDDPDRRAMRGGSYLCHDSYCNRYRVAARTANTADSSAGNLGFRVAWDTE